MPLFGKGRKKERGSEGEEDEFAGSALERLAERQDEMESVVKDFIGESKRRFEDDNKRLGEITNRLDSVAVQMEKLQGAVNRVLAARPSSVPVIATGSSPQESPAAPSVELNESLSVDLARTLAAVNTRLDRLEKAVTEKAEEEGSDPVEVVMKEAYQDLRKKIAKDIAATFKSSTFKIADSYRAKVKKAVLKETESETTGAQSGKQT
jgi:tetrahydromethanopterin S-methyltransferase subunit G